MVDQPRPVRIAIVNDYEIVVAGIAAVLEPYADRVQVVELDSGTPVVSDVDVVLYDSFAQQQGDVVDVEDLVAAPAAKLVVFSWNDDEELVQRSLGGKTAGYLSKGISAEDLVAAIERVHAGEVVTPDPGTHRSDHVFGRWPGEELGLSQREAEVLALITQGLSNQEIAQRAYIGVNTVKTYVRTLYRKIGATRRSQAVRYGMTHGFSPDRVRHVEGRVQREG